MFLYYLCRDFVESQLVAWQPHDDFESLHMAKRVISFYPFQYCKEKQIQNWKMQLFMNGCCRILTKYCQ